MQVNAKSYSTCANAKSHNQGMKFKDWLSEQIAEIGIEPTSLARLVDRLNQPTIQRILSGETPSPREDTMNKIRMAVAIARKNAGLSPSSDTQNGFIGASSQHDKDKESAMLLSFPETSPRSLRAKDHYLIPQYGAGGAMGHGLTLPEQPGVIENWSVSREWMNKNVRNISAPGNLCIVTGFGPSMQPMFNPGDPLLVDTGVNSVIADGIYFFRVRDEGFIKQLQKIPTSTGIKYIAKSKNVDFDPFEITEDMDFEVLGKVVRVWCGTDF